MENGCFHHPSKHTKSMRITILRLLYINNLQFGSCYNHPLHHHGTKGTHDLPTTGGWISSSTCLGSSSTCFGSASTASPEFWRVTTHCRAWNTFLVHVFQLRFLCFFWNGKWILYRYAISVSVFYTHTFTSFTLIFAPSYSSITTSFELPLESGCTYFVTTPKNPCLDPLTIRQWSGNLELD